MIFSKRRADTTWAHQIACLATFESPILTIAANPQSVLENPAVEVIKSVAPVWDETIVLPQSRIGELTVFARRKADMWMLALMRAGDAETIHIPLTFLGPGAYAASLVRDDKDNDAAVAIDSATVQRSDTLSVELRSGGGFLGRFDKR